MPYTLLQAAPAGANYTSFIFMALMLVVLYMFMIRPQQKRRKKQKEYIAALKAGDNIVTVGGLHGKIISLAKDTLVIEIDKGTKVTIERNSVSYENVLQRQ